MSCEEARVSERLQTAVSMTKERVFLTAAIRRSGSVKKVMVNSVEGQGSIAFIRREPEGFACETKRSAEIVNCCVDQTGMGDGKEVTIG
jgi:hypothetical protein